jgi:hypothetical protein
MGTTQRNAHGYDTDAYTDGANARTAGIPFDRCPEDLEWYRLSWRAGWHDVDHRMRAKNKSQERKPHL